MSCPCGSEPTLRCRSLVTPSTGPSIGNMNQWLQRQFSGQPGEEDDALNSVFNLRPVTKEELFDTVKQLRGRSAPGWDSIPTKFIKDNISTFAEPLLHIINLSIRTGKFPDAFKIARVTPIYKSGDKSLFSNYRPISLLSVFSKILEKMVKQQLTQYLVQENIITNEQFGFRQNRNTSDALIRLLNILMSEIS